MITEAVVETTINIYYTTFHNAELVEVGFEPTKLTQQILSLPPLTARELNSNREPRFPCEPSSMGRVIETNSYNELVPPLQRVDITDEGNRTLGHAIKSRALYQLSYTS
jgi:hypothetical protein